MFGRLPVLANAFLATLPRHLTWHVPISRLQKKTKLITASAGPAIESEQRPQSAVNMLMGLALSLEDFRTSRYGTLAVGWLSALAAPYCEAPTTDTSDTCTLCERVT